jgi:hypothetical protein
MNTNIASHTLKNRETWKTRVVLPILLVLLTMSLGATALNHAIPNVDARPQGFSARASWYFQNGQAQADLRSLAATVRFLLDS